MARQFGKGIVATGSITGGSGKCLKIFILKTHQVVNTFDFGEPLLVCCDLFVFEIFEGSLFERTHESRVHVTRGQRRGSGGT
jgi:hypothetical protein